ncbi:MAG: PucR family transcriptional regulator [Firmicutes bacterium]|nr:PucR family transcriptional regulator [Bacillota bacterium]
MILYIKDVLKLEELKGFKVMAGKEGLTNEVKRVGILDYETKEMIGKNFNKGEFIISTLLIIKDDINKLYSIVKELISIGVSGLAIKNIYFNNIPENVIKLANENDFPIMIFSDTYFENIITLITNIINEKEENKILELKIDNILFNDLNPREIKKIAYEINESFKEKNVVTFIKKKSNKKLKGQLTITDDIYSKIIAYKKGYLIIDTFEKIESKSIKDIILKKLENLGITKNDYFIGISSLHEELKELHLAIKESMYSLKYSSIYDNNITIFNEIGANKILLPLIDNPWIEKYCDEMIKPIITYDNKNDTEMLKMVRSFIENNGNIKATAKEMHLHDNTIRYRLDKIKVLLNKSVKIKHFYEELAIAIRIYNIKKKSL